MELASISVHIVTSGVGFFQPVTSLRIFATEQSQNNQDEQWLTRDVWLKNTFTPRVTLAVGYDRTAADLWSTAKAWLWCPKNCHHKYTLVYPSRSAIENVETEGWVTRPGYGLVKLNSTVIRVQIHPVDSEVEWTTAVHEMSQQKMWVEVKILSRT